MFRALRKQFIIPLTFLMMFGFVLSAQAVSPPNIITYQGRVLNANGVPVSDSTLSMSFAFYTASTGGTCVWSNSSATCASTTARTVTLTTGLFTENLGDTSDSYAAISDSIFGDNATLYLEVIIASETLSPRRLITAVPFALNADTLDGIDSATLQLFETGSSRTFEDDAPVIVGSNTAFTYGSGGVGDVRVEDELEVMGDGYIDNDLVVGASTSSTETITNAAFSLGGDDLFVAGTLGVEGTIYTDGSLDVVGTATVGDLSCTDCLDFTELSDTLALDASTSIAMDSAESFTITNSGTGNIIFNLASTGDFLIQDSGTTILSLNDSGNIDMNMSGDNHVQLTATAPPNNDMLVITNTGQATTSSGSHALDITYGVTNTNANVIDITPSFTGGALDTLTHSVININDFTPSNASGTDTVIGMQIGTLTDPGSTIVSNGIRINSGWDVNIFYNDSTTTLRVIDGGAITWQDNAASPNTLMALTDMGSDGRLQINTINAGTGSELDLTAGTGSSSAGGAVDVNAGAGSGAGNAGGAVTIDAGGGATAGTGGAGGSISITAGGAGGTGDNNGGNLQFLGGSATGAGQHGNILLSSGGSPTSLSLDGGDIGLSSQDDLTLSADDDMTFSVTSTSALVSLFDNAVAKTIRIGGVVNDATDTIDIATQATSADTITIGNAHISTTVGITGGNDWSISTAGTATFTFASTGSFALCHATNGAVTEAITDCSAGPTADYAEQYPVADGIEYGDIVVAGTKEIVTTQEDTLVQLMKSSRAYQRPVVGIVSNNYGDFTSAGYNIREEDNPMPVALIGRVSVKVTNEGGVIIAGDYLATSSTPGKAMKATKAGRVIGMALEDWDGGSATIMVQVNNSWSMGDVLGADGTSTLVTNNVIVSAVGTATATELTFDSYGLSLRGSAWNGSQAQAVEMMLQNVVETPDSYRLSIRNTTETEVAYITNEGTMRIAGDMIIGGRLYPSDNGVPQTSKYIYYDGSAGIGGDFMRTNAKGWSTGSYDFAEMFPSDQLLTPGEVVAFASTGVGVRQATAAQGERLAGIVSTRPGFLAGENMAGAYPIALVGRVPTKVNTQNGAIGVGDPLTSSSVAGVASKATQAGQIIGYALENYTGSETDDLILVSVNVGYWSDAVQSITIVQNQASQAPSDAQSFSSLNMSGNIYMATNSILSIGRLEGVSGIWSIESDGTIRTEGSLKTVIESYQGTDVETVAVTSLESVITLTGTSKLVEGRAEVRFEDVVPEYNDVISAIAPIRVIVTPSGPVSLYVSEKDQNHFVVERFAGSNDVEFDWMVTGYRKGFEPKEQKSDVGDQRSEIDIGSFDEQAGSSTVPPATESFVGMQDDTNTEVEEEPASLESPDNLIDSATQDDGGQAAPTLSEAEVGAQTDNVVGEPSDVVIEEPLTPEL